MKLAVIIVFLTGLFGCGYHFSGHGGTLPGNVSKLYIPLFINQTSEPLLENLLSSLVSEVFSRNEQVSQVETAGQADAVLEGRISSYRSRAVSYDRNDDVSEYRAALTVTAVLRGLPAGDPLWQGTVSWEADYLAAEDKTVQEDLEQQAVEEICLRLAEELLNQLAEDF